MEDTSRICPACGRCFKTRQGTSSHLKTSKRCQWYRQGKLADLVGSDAQIIGGVEVAEEPEEGATEWTDDADEGNSNLGEVLEDLEDILNDDTFHFIPLPEPSGIGEAGPGPVTLASRLSRTTSLRLDDEEDTRVEVTHPTAGYVIRVDQHLHEKWRLIQAQSHHHPDNMNIDQEEGFDPLDAVDYSPFASELDWQVAQWVVGSRLGHNALNRLLGIPGVKEKLGISFSNARGLHQLIDGIPDRAGAWHTKTFYFPDRPDDGFVVRHRDPLEAIKSLWGDPTLADQITYAPKKIFSSAQHENRIYNEMWTGKWWHGVQSLLPNGATLAPVIIATDKTQLTQFSGGKAAYPVYLTLGNIPKALRRKPSKQACILIGYLSVDKLRRKAAPIELKMRYQRLFHHSMQNILEPLREAGINGVEMIGGDGEVRRVYPVLATYVADFPEQCLVACAKYGTCPKCLCPSAELQEPQAHPPRTPQFTLGVISDAQHHSKNDRQFHDFCQKQEVIGGVQAPFWSGFPYTNIHTSITPDVLHQLHQGVFKHLIDWCQKAMSAEELDSRIRCLPPSFGVRHFQNGFSILSQISGPERKNMAKILLGCLVGVLPAKAIAACRAILDFIYLAQYPTHDDITLGYMQDALDKFQDNKSFFILAGIRTDFNIPKFHSLLHYIESIQLFGTTDNYNTEAFERFHIDFAKEGWRASNRRDHFPQMIAWLSRQEKIQAFNKYIDWVKAQKTLSPFSSSPPENQPTPGIFIAKNPTYPRQPIQTIQSLHGAPHFEIALKKYLAQFLETPFRQRQPENFKLPFDRLDVYQLFKFKPKGLHDDDGHDWDTVKAGHITPKSPYGRFDTVVAIATEDAESTGLAGTRVGRVKVIFSLPLTIDYGLGPRPIPSTWPDSPLAYVEWYTPLKGAAEDQHLMYVVRKRPTVALPGTIIPLSQIRQSCQLFPAFGRGSVDDSWNSDNVLDMCSSFYINNWRNMYAYQTIW